MNNSKKWFVFSPRLIVVFISIIFSSQSTIAEEVLDLKSLFSMSLEELLNVEVVTSSRKSEKIEDAPNVIYVITADDIKRRGYKSYLDILTTIPGMNVFHGDLGYFSQVRGVAPNSHNKVTFMINGRQINPLVENNMLTGPITLDNAEKVEIIVGPGSVLYGAETLLAIVNIITKKEDHNELTIRVGQDLNADADQLGFQNIVATFAKKWDDNENFTFSMSALKSSGWDGFDTLNISNPNDYDKTGRNILDNYLPSYFLTANARHDEYHLQYVSYNAEQVDIGRSRRYDTEGVRIDKMDDLMFQILKEHNKNVDTRFQVNFSNKRTARMTIEGKGGNADLAETQYNFEYAINYQNSNHHLQFGLKYIVYQDRFNYDILWYPDDPDSSRESSHALQLVENSDYNSYGFYISEEWMATNKLKLVGASRFDRNEVLKEKKIYITPRLAAIYKLTDKITSKLIFNTSTHMPTASQSPLNQLYGSDKPEGVAPVWAATNTLATKPERLRAYEFQNIFSFEKHRISLNLYYQEIDDFISWFNPTTNMGNFSGTGVELDWKSKISNSINLWANVSFTNTDFELTAKKFKESSNFPSNEDGESVAVPKHNVNMGSDLRIKKHCYLSLVARVFTRQPAYFIEADPTADNGQSERWDYVNNQFYFDANLLFENVITDDLDISINCKNLTNNTQLVAAQYRTYRYSPRGIALYLAVNYRY